MNQLKQGVWEYSLKNPKGFTLSLETLEPVTIGICVAYKETQNSHGRESLEKVIQHALDHDKVVGGWFNERNGLYYYDSIKVFQENEFAKAIDFAIENEQEAIFDLRTKQEVTINK